MRFYFDSPAAVWAAMALAAVVALHLLARRRREVTLPTLIIWRRVAPSTSDTSLRRFRIDRSLVLRLLAAAALVAAAAGPVAVSPGSSVRRAVIVIDNSLAMQSMAPGGRSRLQDASAAARKLLGAMSASDRATLVVTSPDPAMPARGESPGDVTRAVDSISPSDRAASLDEAVAAALAEARRSGGRVYVFTSRPRPDGLAEGAVHWKRVGAPSRNVALVAMDSAVKDGSVRLFIAVRNYSARHVNCPVVIEALKPGGGEALWRTSLSLAPGDRRTAVTEVPMARIGGGIAVRLDCDDDIAADNVAYGVPSSSRPFKVALFGSSSAAITRAVKAGAEGGELVEMTRGSRLDGVDADMLVFCRAPLPALPKALAAKPVLVVVPFAPIGPLAVEGVPVPKPGPMAASPGAELLKGLDLSAISPVQITRARVTGAFRVLATAGGLPVLGEWETTAGATRYYLGLVPDETSWPDDPTWPIIWARLARRHGGSPTGEIKWRTVADDSPVTGMPPGASSLTGPRGEYDPSLGLPDAGLYRSGEHLVAVNILDEAASDNRAPAAAPAASSMPTPVAEPVETRLAPWILALALMLMSAEWLLGRRR